MRDSDDKDILQKISKQLDQINGEVDYINKVTKELINVVNGSIGMDGLIQRLRAAETERKQQGIKDAETVQRFLEDNNAFKVFVMQHLNGIEGNLDDKFNSLKKDIESKFNSINEFKNEIADFKQRIETYLNLATGKTTWSFIFKVSIALITLGIILYGIIEGKVFVILKALKDNLF